MILTFNQFKQQLTTTVLNLVQQHFNEIYTCNTINEQELKITYLAYLWKNNYVLLSDGGYIIKEEELLGIDMYKDFELNNEVEPGEEGGVNLGITHDFYAVDKLAELISFEVNTVSNL